MRNDVYSFMNELNNMFYGDESYRSFPIDVTEIENGYEVYAEMPGVTKEDIKVTFDKGELTIQAKPAQNKDVKYLVHERNTMNLKRTVNFGDISEDQMNAKYENGILKVTITTKVPEEKQAKQICIE